MSERDRRKGPLVAAYDYARNQEGLLSRREEVRDVFALQLEGKMLAALNNWGTPMGEDWPHVTVTPTITLMTGRGDVDVRVMAIQNNETRESERLTLEIEYANKQRSPFVQPEKPSKCVSVGVMYYANREPFAIVMSSRHWSDATIAGAKYKEPRIKRLRQANTIMDFLIEQYEKAPVENSNSI